MKLSEFIRDALQLAGEGNDPELELFDRNRGVELINDPNEGDEGRWDFEVMRGDNSIVIEFD